MKKLISLLLAVSLLMLSTTAFAAGNLRTVSGEGSNRNYNVSTVNYTGTSYFRPLSSAQVHLLAGFRPGDKLTFRGENYSTASGDFVTFICSNVSYTDKSAAVAYSTGNVMFIDQIEVSGPSFTYTCTLREDLPDGLYRIDMKAGDEALTSYFFFVAEPKVTVASVDEAGTDYVFETADGTKYFVGSLNTTNSYVDLRTVGTTEFGLDLETVNGAKYDFRIPFSTIAATTEVSGRAAWNFAVEVEGSEDVEFKKPTGYVNP